MTFTLVSAIFNAVSISIVLELADAAENGPLKSEILSESKY
jgi:hypothetical protein